MEADEVEEEDADVTGEGGEASGLLSAFLKFKAFLVDLAREHVAYGPEAEPREQRAHDDEDESDDGREKGGADRGGHGLHNPRFHIGVDDDEKDEQKDADACFNQMFRRNSLPMCFSALR